MTFSQKQPLVRVTVNLIPRAAAALELATELTGDSKTDVLNRAIQFYAYVEEITSRGGEFHVRENGETSRLVLTYPDRRAEPEVPA